MSSQVMEMQLTKGAVRWIAAMKSAAESQGRDPLYAVAMADASVDLPELGAPEGEFLTLTQSAVEVGYAEECFKQNRFISTAGSV